MNNKSQQQVATATQSPVVAYLGEKACAPSKEWLKREPRATLPLIREAVRSAKESGLFYDDDVNRYVAEMFAIVPHGPLFDQLGHETYIAKGEIRDEEAMDEITKAAAEGYESRQLSKLPDGRYLIRHGTTYVGRTVADYGAPKEYRVKNGAHYAKYARTGYGVTGWALVKPL